MVDHGVSYEVVGGVSPYYHKEDYWEDNPAHWGGRLVLSPRRRGYKGGGDVSNVGICMEAAVNNCRIYCKIPDLLTV